jgi:hypothetical protein
MIGWPYAPASSIVVMTSFLPTRYPRPLEPQLWLIEKYQDPGFTHHTTAFVVVSLSPTFTTCQAEAVQGVIQKAGTRKLPLYLGGSQEAVRLCLASLKRTRRVAREKDGLKELAELVEDQSSSTEQYFLLRGQANEWQVVARTGEASWEQRFPPSLFL